MRSAITKKANQDEERNQTTITTNFNYIENFMSNFKKKQTYEKTQKRLR